MSMNIVDDVSLSPEQIKEHYEIEKELASRLRNASKQERKQLYAKAYDEMLRRVPYHPMLTRKSSPEERAADASMQMKLLKPFLKKGSTFLEVGPGDCALSFEVAKIVKQVYAIDVSDEMTRNGSAPENFSLILSDGCSVPLGKDSVDLAYSNQLMEHLHPEDAFEQLQNIYSVLSPGGAYICITPSRYSGPHDISKYFDSVATGFHLSEYTTLELKNLFNKVGFSKVKVFVGAKGKYLQVPAFPVVTCEWLLNLFPDSFRKTIAVNLPFNLIFGNIRILGIK